MDLIKEDFFQLKADLIPLTVLKLTHLDMEGIQQQLVKIINKAPNYFRHAPILIDVSELSEQNALDINALLTTLKNQQLIPVAIRGSQEKIETQAEKHGLAILKKPTIKEKPTKSTLNNQSPTKIITKPVRAGSQIYAKGGDLIILAAVNPGAECFADGSIHVYGPLRGRALAGINGDENARIFCKALEAELIAIAGHYQVKENILKPDSANGMIQIYLDNQKLQINSI